MSRETDRDDSQGESHSPWLGPLAGYERFKPWDDGTWASMMYPGNSGYALAVTLLYEADSSPEIQAPTPNGYAPLLVPAVVEWSSIIDDDGSILPECYAELSRIDRDDGLASPTVRIHGESSWTASHDYPIGSYPQTHNAQWPIDCPEDYIYELISHENRKDRVAEQDGLFSALPWTRHMEPPEPVNGYMSVLALTPIDSRAFKAIGEAIRDVNAMYPMCALSVTYDEIDQDEDDLYFSSCHCSIDHYAVGSLLECTRRSCERYGVSHKHEYYHEVNEKRCRREGHCPCDWDSRVGRCACGSTWATATMDIEALADAINAGKLDAKAAIIPRAYHRLWDYAVERWLTGLQATAALADEAIIKMNGEEQCFTSSWRQRSPYSGMPSLEAHRRILLPVSSDSRRQLAS